jgi:xanthine dehydrogenase accessory factor
MDPKRPLVLIRGGGDLGSGVTIRLHRSGFGVLITEVEKPLVVRRAVAFAEAVYEAEVDIEGVIGRLVSDHTAIEAAFKEQVIPVHVDPQAEIQNELKPNAIIDARMRKKAPESTTEAERIIIGLGPGFTAGLDCHAVIETNRGHMMGRVIWNGPAQADTGVPEPVGGYDVDRVLRAPVSGLLKEGQAIGTLVKKGEIVVEVGDTAVRAPFDGVLRGLIHDGLQVQSGMKIGDLDPRGVVESCFTVSDKALAVGGGVLEALLSFEDIRKVLAY